jgi:micrococcal nuclease
MYQYNAVIQKVVDGDTIEIDIDLGLSTWIHGERIRLYGIDTPEVYGVKKGSAEWEKGNETSTFVKQYLKENDQVVIETIKDKREKYGRYLALIYVHIEPSVLEDLKDIRTIDGLFCLNDILIAKGLAQRYML